MLVGHALHDGGLLAPHRRSGFDDRGDACCAGGAAMSRATHPAATASRASTSSGSRAEDEGRTEEPSEYKLRKAREEGRVAKSQELIGAVGLLLPAVAVMVILAPYFARRPSARCSLVLHGLVAARHRHGRRPSSQGPSSTYFLKLTLARRGSWPWSPPSSPTCCRSASSSRSSPSRPISPRSSRASGSTSSGRSSRSRASTTWPSPS